jgi:hypothetical protein
MTDTQSDPGAWAAEIEQMGTRAPGARPAERTFIESFFRARRADPRFHLEQGDIRLARADQRMLVEMVRALEDAVTGAPTADEVATISLRCERVADTCRSVESLVGEVTRGAQPEGWSA